MGLFSRVFIPEQRKFDPFARRTPLFGFRSAGSHTGQTVTPEVALGLPSVFAAVGRLSETVGSLPLHLYRETDRGKELATNHRLYRTFLHSGNVEMPANELWSTVMRHMLLWGNAYLLKGRNAYGLVDELIPIPPDRVIVRRENGQKLFDIALVNGDRIKDANVRDILHMRYMTLDGLIGFSPIGYYRQGLGIQLAQEEYMGQFYRHSAQPSGVLTYPNGLDDEGFARLKAEWESFQSGAANAGKSAVLEDGTKWESIAIPPKDQEFVEQRRFGVQEVCRVYQIPAWILNESSGDSLTYANTTEANRFYLDHSIRPLLVKVESFLVHDGDLLIEQSLCPKFDADALLRADLKTRYEAHGIAIDKGFMNRNEVRTKEDMPTVEGLDEYVTPKPGNEQTVNVNQGPAPAPQDPSEGRTEVREQSDPDIDVQLPEQPINITVPEPKVTVIAPPEKHSRTVKVKRDKDGNITAFDVE